MSFHDAAFHAQLFSYDTKMGRVAHLTDLGQALGEDARRSIPQGKVHVRPIELDGCLLAATHIGYYDRVRGMAVPGTRRDRRPYPGGHFVSYELATGVTRSLGRAPAGEGILSVAVDAVRGRMFGLTWPSGRLLRHELSGQGVLDLGPACGAGETLDRHAEQVCRTLVVDPGNGAVYWTREDGSVQCLEAQQERIRSTGMQLRSVLGGEPWRAMVWNPTDQAFWGTLVRSGSVVRFAPSSGRIRVFPSFVPPDGPTDSRGRPYTRASLGCLLTHDDRYLRTLVRDWIRSPLGYWASQVSMVSFEMATGQVIEKALLRWECGRAVEQADSLETVGNHLYAIGRPRLDGWQRVQHAIMCRLGHEHDAYPGAFRLLEWEDHLAP